MQLKPISSRLSLVPWRGVCVGVLVLAVAALASLGCQSGPERAAVKQSSLKALDDSAQAAVWRAARHARERSVRIRDNSGSVGSGALVSADGWIVTAAHVVGDARLITSDLPNGISLPGRVVALNPINDFAIVKVNATGLPFFEIGPRPARGIRVVAVGSSQTDMLANVSTGVVLYPKVRIPGESNAYYYDALFHTAPIFPGDSGGPLVLLDGRLVGVHGGYASQRTGVGPALDDVLSAVGMVDGGLDIQRLRFHALTTLDPLMFSFTRPDDFAQSSQWTIDSIADTLFAVYPHHGQATIMDLLLQTRQRYVAGRAKDKRTDAEVVRAMLQEIFENLDSSYLE